MSMEFSEVLDFWFPASSSWRSDHLSVQLEWWYRGGADAAVRRRFVELNEWALAGQLDRWTRTPRGRLALIIVLDQFTRAIHRGTAGTYAGDPAAVALAREGLQNGHYEAILSPWQRVFFALPLLHSEEAKLLEQGIQCLRALRGDAPQSFDWWFEMILTQARWQMDVLSRFGRDPRRNAVLGRSSTPAERDYLGLDTIADDKLSL
jgi:uncharacterized protein (DUF924 family)